jgi:hypothetical protein
MGFGSAAIRALMSRPLLAVEALRAWGGMRRRGFPLPSRVYLRWRLVTAYGDELTTPRVQDVLEYLRWRREMRSMRRGGRWG